MSRPLLFLDVDGTLLPFRSQLEPTASAPEGDPLLQSINPDHGRLLAALGCDLIWATAWMTEANDDISPILGFPQLPVVIWPERSSQDDQDEQAGLHWKTRALVTWAAGRPFIWVDDETTDADRAWVQTHHPAQALVHTVAPEVGLTPADFTTLREWLTTVS
ncbi:HAD domain-containing protein [Kribbella sp. NPDC055071]